MKLKFRAWDKDRKYMEYTDENLLVCFGGNGKVVLTDLSSVYSNCEGMENFELMQSTDMVDRNGNIIFEGDIVKMSKDVYSEPTYYEVVRHYGGAYRLESKQHGCELWLRHTDCEVVGNVYENLDLLEDKE